MNGLEFSTGGRRWRADLARPVDLAIALDFGGPQPRFFAASPAGAEPLQAGSFTGSVERGASCNCATYTLAPHCHGTHTECVGHLTRGGATVAALTPVPPMLAVLVTVAPQALGAAAGGSHAAPTDPVIDAAALEAACRHWQDAPWAALVVLTLPNDPAKRYRAYPAVPCPAPYFTADAMRWIVARGVTSLVCDLPSLDRADDGGRLEAHRLYWGLPPGSQQSADALRPRALVTELAYVPEDATDGLYLLDLQVAAFVADAAPSRPVLYPMTEVACA
ncbi:MAG: cyclase family protein [Steroidobacteraceae bacterium]